MVQQGLFPAILRSPSLILGQAACGSVIALGGEGRSFSVLGAGEARSLALWGTAQVSPWFPSF